MAAPGTKRALEINAPAGEWIAGPSALYISAHEIHVWKVDLSQRAVPDADAVLSFDELERASRFHFERDRQHYMIAHSALRIILARYLNLPAAMLAFGQTEYGKPFLTNLASDGLLFNMSHSGDVAVIAISREREVGVDVEFMRADFATAEVAGHFFSVAEIYTLCGLDRHQRSKAFFDCWTRKEAYVKARGEGLSIPLDQFDVSLAPGVEAAMLGNRIDDAEKSRWTFRDFHVAQGYAAALVIEHVAAPPRLSYFALTS